MVTEDISLKVKFQQVRKCTEMLCSRLSPEDHVVQPVEEVSPPKWHLAHTTWFFETFILQPGLKDYKKYHDNYGLLFNSYYESAGPKIIRSSRGNLTRPTVQEVLNYREYVDEQMMQMLENEAVADLVELGLQHEQQHQELLLYDIKYILGNNPLFPVYVNNKRPDAGEPQPANFVAVPQGIYDIGYDKSGFCFDNELGAHKVYLHDYGIMNRLVTNGEYLEFINDAGYQQFGHWLSEGWEWVKDGDVKAPYHWHLVDGQWHQYSLNGGLNEVDMNAPVTHISFFEADAFAKWRGQRLPTEFEWEVAARIHSGINKSTNCLEDENYEPVGQKDGYDQMFGDVWEWTNSAYLPYPYYEVPKGAVGEYNGKFMINQMVLRGGSCATPKDHIRATYRNFFHPHLRWMFTGIRLAQSL